MNAPPESLETDLEAPVLDTPPLTLESDGEESGDSGSGKNGKHRLKGKIARLPKPLRQKINTMLDDGVAYPAIILKLQESADPPLPYAGCPSSGRDSWGRCQTFGNPWHDFQATKRGNAMN